MNNLEYRKSLSRELLAVRNRVRCFVNHWPEDGRYKEILLIEMIKDMLPNGVSVGTGFVVDTVNDNKTSQIDIIIYQNKYPELFKKGDFVIVIPESVVGIIEVKSKVGTNVNIDEILKKAHKNGEFVAHKIFNGIFCFESSYRLNEHDELPDSLSYTLREYSGRINNICFGSDYFMKYWEAGLPTDDYINDHISFYHMEELAFGYFISNLIKDVWISLNGERIPQSLLNSLFPIPNGKEERKIQNLEIELPNNV